MTFPPTYHSLWLSRAWRISALATLTLAASSLALVPARASTYTLKSLFSFNGANGADPDQGVVIDSNDNLYGPTNYDTTDYYGTIFELANTGTSANPAYSSTANPTLAAFDFNNGRAITPNVIIDSRGNIYGDATAGGDLTQDNGFGGGTIYTIANTGTAANPSFASGINVLTTLNSTTGFAPDANVTFDTNGNMFLATTAGGTNNAGTVLEFANTGTAAAPNYTGAPMALANFNGTNGSSPEGTLIIDSHGNLFGTAFNGGDLTTGYNNTGDGTVYEMINTGTVSHPAYAGGITTLGAFEGTNGDNPAWGLVMDSKGNLYGTGDSGGDLTVSNGYGDGDVFEVANTGTVANPIYTSGITDIANFEGANGAGPEGNLTINSAGNLFGVTGEGGDLTTNSGYGDGSVFTLVNTGTGGAPSYGTGITSLADFDGTDGISPVGTLALDSDGNLFGSTGSGGTDGDGTVFELSPSTNTSAPEPAALALLLPLGVPAAWIMFGRSKGSSRANA